MTRLNLLIYVTDVTSIVAVTRNLFHVAEAAESSVSLIAPYPSNVSVSAGQKATFRCTVSVSGTSSHLPHVQVNIVHIY